MSKLQPSPEVLLSIDARRSQRGRSRLFAVHALALIGLCAAGCLAPETNEAASDVALTDGTSDGTTGDASGTTHAPIMTTTEEPETTYDASSSSSESGSESTTTG